MKPTAFHSLFAGLTGALAFSISFLPRNAPAAPPSWWTSRSVLDASQINNDFSAVNTGQLKHIAKQAMLELDARLPGGAGTGVHALVSSWSAPQPDTNDFAAVNVGQVKAVAKPFYDRLKELRYVTVYPWGPATDDYAMANTGQVKALFSFDVTLDTDADSLPDLWERAHWPDLTAASAGGDSDDDGLNNFQEFQQQTAPTLADSDGDEWEDGAEASAGSSNSNPASTPVTADPDFLENIATLHTAGFYANESYTNSVYDHVESGTVEHSWGRQTNTYLNENWDTEYDAGWGGGTGWPPPMTNIWSGQAIAASVQEATFQPVYFGHPPSYSEVTIVSHSEVQPPTTPTQIWYGGNGEIIEQTFQGGIFVEANAFIFALKSPFRLPVTLQKEYVILIYEVINGVEHLQEIMPIRADLSPHQRTGDRHIVYRPPSSTSTQLRTWYARVYPAEKLTVPVPGLPMQSIPGAVAANSDFDEGCTAFISPSTSAARSDSHNSTLIAERTSVDGRISAGDVVTDDLYEGWFGISPDAFSDSFYDGAQVTITKKDKIDSTTGLREPGQVRFFATWGTNQEMAIQVDDPFIDDLLVNNPAPRNLVGKVYGSNKTIPSGARFWLEGITPGKITLEFRIRKNGMDIRHEQTFEIRNDWTKAEWLSVVRDELYLDSFTTSGGAHINGFSNTAVDIDQYVVANQFPANRAYIYTVYEYYAKLHDDKFLWAGLAKLAGHPVYAGLSDAQNGRYGLAIAPFGVLADPLLAGIQDILIDANIKIYKDLGYQFAAYRTGGIKSIKYLFDEQEITQENYDAWKDIDKGTAPFVASGNQTLLRREQEVILAQTYIDLMAQWWGWADDAFSWLTRNPVPGGPAFQAVIPSGNIAVFNDRWAWITDPVQGMWLLWTGKSYSQRAALANPPLRTGAAGFAFFSRYGLAPLQ